VSTGQTILLGAIAGFAIYLGLPLGRVRLASLKTRTFLNAASAGILVFLLVEILGHATEPVEHAVEEAAEGKAGWGQFAALGLVYAVGFRGRPARAAVCGATLAAALPAQGDQPRPGGHGRHRDRPGRA
jgi:hypothetical protein